MRLAAALPALLGLGACAIGGGGGGLPQPGPLPKLDAELAAIVDDRAYPLASLSVAAIRDGKIAYERQFGLRVIDYAQPSHSKNADRATLYRVASTSKLVTTLGVMRLVEQGRLDLDRDAGEYLGYRLRNPQFPDAPVTLRMLLTHTSSLRDDGGYIWPEGTDLKDVLVPGGKHFGTGAMWSARARPGAWFSYANLPWGVIGTVMEKATGERFDRLMKRLVLEPLGMRGGFNPAEFTAEELANLATLYRKRPPIDDAPWVVDGPWIAQVDDYSLRPPVARAGPGYVAGTNGALFGPQGGLRASTHDLARVLLMIANDGELDGKRFLAKASIEAMLARQWTFEGNRPNGACLEGTGTPRFYAWGLGNQQFRDISGPACGDRLVEGGGFTGIGHTADAYGLTGVIVIDRARKDGLVFVVGGPGFNPVAAPGRYSGLHRYEERILTAVHRHALQLQN